MEKNVISNNNPDAISIRKELDQVVRRIYPCDEGQGICYLVGTAGACIHSEPKKDVPRIFFSVLPASKRQIEQWADKRGRRAKIR